MQHQTNSSLSYPVDHFFRGAFSIDIVLLTYHERKLKVLLQEKQDYPEQDQWGLPGKLLLPNEDTDQAMNRLLESTIGTSNFYKKQLQAFSDVGRHPLGRVITFAYYGLISNAQLGEHLTKNFKWVELATASQLSYDHDKILSRVLSRFRKGLLRHPTVFELLPEEFILSDIIKIYELAFDKKFDISNFRFQLKRSDLITPLGKFSKSPGHLGRPAELYAFKREAYKGESKERVQFNF